MGYDVLDIIEVNEYEVVKYNPQKCEGGLFADYINTFLKLRAVVREYSSSVRTPVDFLC
jgi:hypothetical protein